MESRRKFLQISAAALTAAAAKPLFGAGVQGANDRIRMAIIGAGNRGGRVFDSFHAAQGLPVPCRRRSQQAEARPVDDAGAPDLQARRRRGLPPHPRSEGHRRGAHRHPRPLAQPAVVDAISAGKDVYVREAGVELDPRINAMLDAYTRASSMVQIGTHQRSWDHFIEAKKLLETDSRQRSRRS